MQHIESLLTKDRRIGTIVPHDDDYGALGHAEAKTIGLPKNLITLTPSNRGTKNFAPLLTNIQNGGRLKEGEAGARVLDYQTFARLYAPDGELSSYIDDVTPSVTEWIRHYNLNLLLSTRRLRDHPDHVAAGIIALRAAQIVAVEDNRDIGVLEVHPSTEPQGEYIAKASPESRQLLHAALAENRSQFRYEHPEQADENYVVVSHDFALHPEDYDELSYYPIEAARSTYTFIEVGRLAMAQTASLATV